MANIRFMALFVLSVFFCAAFARTAMDAAQAANEIDTVYCTKSNANMVDYCTGYCELESGQSCEYVSHNQTSNPNVIDQCVCKCGAGGEELTYNDVPCGIDRVRKASPSNGSSICCLPAFALLGVVCFVSNHCIRSL